MHTDKTESEGRGMNHTPVMLDSRDVRREFEDGMH